MASSSDSRYHPHYHQSRIEGVMTVSRKWERMVEKNRKNVNKVRKKHGQKEISYATDTVREPVDTIKGRSWMLPLFLIAFSLVYLIGFYDMYPEHDWGFWFVGFCYIGLGVLIYLTRRPMIRIAKKSLTVRRYTGDRTVEAHEIKELTVSPSHVSIDLQGKRGRWTYTKLQHRFPMDELQAKLKEFALQNQVALKEESR